MNKNCKSCGMTFEMSVGEVEWYKMKGFPEPKKCKGCKNVEKEKKERYRYVESEKERKLKMMMKSKSEEKKEKRGVYDVLMMEEEMKPKEEEVRPKEEVRPVEVKKCWADMVEEDEMMDMVLRKSWVSVVNGVC